MIRYAITQTGPAIGSGEVCYMVGKQNTSEQEGVYYGEADSIAGALRLLMTSPDSYIRTDEPFTIEYIPWRE